MSRCGVVYVALAEVADLDRLERCDQPMPCLTHQRQLDWVRARWPRIHAYQRQVDEYEAALRVGAQVAQESLL